MRSPRTIPVATALVAAIAAAAGPTWICREVIDGDTIVAESDTGQVVRIDLFGVDAPEIGQPFGGEARSFLEGAALGRELALARTGNDDSSVTASVSVDGVDLSEALVRSGFAWLPADGASSDVIAIALFGARSEGAGLWSDSKAEHPSLWRESHRPAQPTPAPPQRLADIAATIKLAGEDGQAAVISDIPSAFTRDRETKLLVDNMAVIAAAAENLAQIEAAFARHCSSGAGSSTSTGG